MNVIDFSRKHCEKIRSYLDFYINNELLTETNHEVLTHLKDCPGCAEALEARLRVKGLVQNAVRRAAAPPALREKIREGLRAEQARSRPHSRWRLWALAAAAAVVLTFGALGAFNWRAPYGGSDVGLRADAARLHSEQTASILKVGLGDHIHCAIDSKFAGRSFTLEEMAEKMGPAYAGLLPVVRESLPGGYRVTIGHHCKWRGRGFVHLILRNEDRAVSLIITKKNGESFPAAELAARLEGSGVPLYRDRLEGWAVAGFESRDYLGFVISDLADEENLRLASVVAPGMLGFLDKLAA